MSWIIKQRCAYENAKLGYFLTKYDVCLYLYLAYNMKIILLKYPLLFCFVTQVYRNT